MLWRSCQEICKARHDDRRYKGRRYVLCACYGFLRPGKQQTTKFSVHRAPSSWTDSPCIWLNYASC